MKTEERCECGHSRHWHAICPDRCYRHVTKGDLLKPEIVRCPCAGFRPATPEVEAGEPAAGPEPVETEE